MEVVHSFILNLDSSIKNTVSAARFWDINASKMLHVLKQCHCLLIITINTNNTFYINNLINNITINKAEYPRI